MLAGSLSREGGPGPFSISSPISMALPLAILSIPFLLFFVWKALSTISYYYLTPRRIKRIMAGQGITGPKPFFLFGNLGDIRSRLERSTKFDMPVISHNILARVLPHYVSFRRSYGEKFIVWHGSEPRLCLTDTNMIRTLLSTKNEQLGRSWLQRYQVENLVGLGVLMADGKNWSHQRDILARYFMANKLQDYVWYMIECTRHTVNELHAAVATNNSEVEIGQHFSRLIENILARSMFGSRYEMGKQIFHYLTSLRGLTIKSHYHQWIPGKRFFPTCYSREIKETKKTVDTLLIELLESSKSTHTGSSYGKSLTAILLEERRSRRDLYSIRLLTDELKNTFFSAHEAMTLLLTWTIMLLAENSTWQEMARLQVEQVCGRESLSAGHISRLYLLDRIIRESLRLYPPITSIQRAALHDIQLDGLLIPKGTTIWIPILAIHHDETIWGDDVHDFNPNRYTPFIDDYFFPFASGPRNCLGKDYALVGAKVVLAMLLLYFTFDISPNYKHAPVDDLTLHPKNGVVLQLTPLRPSP